LSNQSEVNRLLAKGVASARAGQRAEAYNLLLDVVDLDRHNELAWLWLSTVTDDLEDQRICLENALTVNPDNQAAREQLAVLAANGSQQSVASSGVVICPQCGAGNRDFVRKCGACGYAFFRPCAMCGEFNLADAQTCGRCGASLTHVETQPTPEPAVLSDTSSPVTPFALWPVVAFWVGVSFFFLAGGLLSIYQFMGIVLRARGVLQNLTPIQAAWLPMGMFFIVFGFTGLSLAWQLGRRQPTGYYGSLVFGLFLTLVGPSVSLVLVPPDYLTTVFAGLMPAVAVLFTLASITGFESNANHL